MADELTATRLRALLDYDPETGLFVWRAKTGNQGAGAKAGSRHKGYFCIQVDKTIYKAHRLAWLWMTGEWPLAGIDHKDCDGRNNRWANLRAADQHTNMQNQRRAHSSGSTGLLGAHSQDGRFRARISVAGANVSLGMYDSAEAAHAAYVAAKRELHPGNTL